MTRLVGLCVRVCFFVAVISPALGSFQVAVMRHNAKLEVLPEEQIEAVCKVRHRRRNLCLS